MRGRGLTVDTDGFDAAMDKQKETGKANWKGSGDAAGNSVWQELKDRLGPTRFTGYDNTTGSGEVLALLQDGELVDAVDGGDVEILLDETPFYAESGGQAGDHGTLTFASGAVLTVSDVQKRAGSLHAHIGTLTAGGVKTGDRAEAVIDTDRRAAIKANHSATHILHAALRNVLGTHVTQKGSLVEADRLRFDFSHGQPVTKEELLLIEDQVNAIIRQNEPVSTREMAPEQAIEEGALALFGEKYGDIVRVLTMGKAMEADHHFSMEFCGGTHVGRTGDIAVFTILSEGGVSAGIRRIEATTAKAAFEHLRSQVALGQAAADKLKTPLSTLSDRVSGLVEQRKELEKELSETKRQLAMGGGSGAAAPGPEEVNGVKLIARVLDGVPAKELRTLMDDAKNTLGSGVAVFVAVNDGKAAVATGVTKDLLDKVSAVDLVKVAAAAVGGKGGGGRPDMAQAGGPDGDKAEDALAAVRDVLKAL